jgi:hypothetical protein
VIAKAGWLANCGDPGPSDDPRHTGRVIKIENTPHLSASWLVSTSGENLSPAFSTFYNNPATSGHIGRLTNPPGQRGR